VKAEHFEVEELGSLMLGPAAVEDLLREASRRSRQHRALEEANEDVNIETLIASEEVAQ
jgi:hypothetical protein